MKTFELIPVRQKTQYIPASKIFTPEQEIESTVHMLKIAQAVDLLDTRLNDYAEFWKPIGVFKYAFKKDIETLIKNTKELVSCNDNLLGTYKSSELGQYIFEPATNMIDNLFNKVLVIDNDLVNEEEENDEVDFFECHHPTNKLKGMGQNNFWCTSCYEHIRYSPKQDKFLIVKGNFQKADYLAYMESKKK